MKMNNIKEFEVAKKKGMKKLIRNLIIGIALIVGLWYYFGNKNGWFNIPKDDFAYSMFILYPVIASAAYIDRALDAWDKFVARLKKQYGLVGKHGRCV